MLTLLPNSIKIALQFPDELLHDSVPIYRRLKPLVGIGRELYVLADTSYGRHALFLSGNESFNLMFSQIYLLRCKVVVLTKWRLNMLRPMPWFTMGTPV